MAIHIGAVAHGRFRTVAAIATLIQNNRTARKTCRPTLWQAESAVDRLWRGRSNMRRREFITLLGGAAAAWPLAARAQQAGMPVIGYASGFASTAFPPYLAGFRHGLEAASYVEGRNVAIEYRWADSQYDRLPALATDLVRRQVTMIVATGVTASPLAAKAATATIPIVFLTVGDPIKLGLVSSFNRPTGNLTGVTWLNNTMAAKRLELLHQLVPAAKTIGLLVNPANPNASAERETFWLRHAPWGCKCSSRMPVPIATSTRPSLDLFKRALARCSLAAIRSSPPGAIKWSRWRPRHALPTCHDNRPVAETGGLMSYGASTNSTRIARSVSMLAGF